MSALSCYGPCLLKTIPPGFLSSHDGRSVADPFRDVHARASLRLDQEVGIETSLVQPWPGSAPQRYGSVSRATNASIIPPKAGCGAPGVVGKPAWAEPVTYVLPPASAIPLT